MSEELAQLTLWFCTQYGSDPRRGQSRAAAWVSRRQIVKSGPMSNKSTCAATHELVTSEA